MPNNNTANYPTSLATDSTLFVAAIGAASSLSSGINSTATSATVALGSVFAYPCLIQIDTEFIAVGTVSGNTLSSLTRGFAGSTAASHALGASVVAYSFPYLFNQQNAEIKAIESALGTNLSNVLLPSQTLVHPVNIPVAAVSVTVEGMTPYSFLNLPNSANAPLPIAFDDTGGNGSLYATLEFSDGQFAQGHFTLPQDWVASSNIVLNFAWRSSSVSGSVQWSCALGYLAATSAPNLSFGSPVSSTGAVSGTSNATAFTSLTLTPPVGLVAGNELFFNFARGSDSAGSNAQLISMQFDLTRLPF